MGRHTYVEQRMECFRLHEQGGSYAAIAEKISRSPECVRYWCRRLKRGGDAQSHYGCQPRGLLHRFDPMVKYVILRLKLKHKRWGPNRIRFHLKKRPSLTGLRLPSEAQLGRYLHQWARFRRQPRPAGSRQRPHAPTRVHQRWEIDFKMGIALQDGTLVNLYTLVDPVGEACIGAFLYPAGKVGHAPIGIHFNLVRLSLRYCFAKWHTLPEEIQTDGEKCLLAERRLNDFPTIFTLWLKGLGIEHLGIRPGQPRDNAEVEREHRTLNDYALVGNEDANFLRLRVILEQAVYELVYELPSGAPGCAHRPPIEAHPELLDPQKPFQPELERLQFDLKRVDQFLAGRSWTRSVSKNGVVELGGQRYFMGRIHVRQEVSIKFDPLDRHFVFSPLTNPELKIRCPAKGLDLDDFLGPAEDLVPQQLAFPFLSMSYQGVSL